MELVPRLRLGRRVPQHVYMIAGQEPSDADIPIWTAPDVRWAEMMVQAFDALRQAQPEPQRPRPIECPRCGGRERIEVNLVDTGVGSYVTHAVGSYRCLNPECPTNRPRVRVVHAHPTWNSGYGPERVPCCGLLLAELPTGTVTTSDPHNVTCGGQKITDNPEEGPNHG